jgi:hypothetical protein
MVVIVMLQPTTQIFFYKCILQDAIDFAELPILARQGVAGFAPEPNF